jgi:hypothetical protein
MHNSRKIDSVLSSNTSGRSYSATTPALTVRIRSDSIIVSNLCAMVKIVRCEKCFFNTSLTAALVSESKAAVASSKSRMGDGFNIARAKQMSCCVPREKLAPKSSTLVASPSLLLASTGPNKHLCKMSRRTSSVCWLNGSRLVRRVPPNMTGSWGMIAILLRSVCNFTWEQSISFTSILPADTSANRYSAIIKDAGKDYRGVTDKRIELRERERERENKEIVGVRENSSPAGYSFQITGVEKPNNTFVETHIYQHQYAQRHQFSRQV